MNCFQQEGIITEISNGIIWINISSFSACANCHAKGTCNILEVRDKSIPVYDWNNSYSIGEHVKIIIKKTLGFKALLLAYVIPFILIILSLLIFLSCSGNELTSGIFSLLVLFPYYLILFLNKKRLKKVFTCKIKEMGDE